MSNAEIALPMDDPAAQAEPQEPLSRGKSWLIGLLLLAAAAGFMLWLVLPGKASADPAVTRHEFEGGQLTWSISDYPAIVLGPNHFTIELHDAAGAAIRDAALQVKLDMMGMVCGDYNFELKEISPGVYEGEGVPLMAGLWKATLTIGRGDNEPVTISRTLKAVY